MGGTRGLLKDDLEAAEKYIKSLGLSDPATSTIAGTVVGPLCCLRCTSYNSLKLNFLPIAIPYLPYATIFFGTYDTLKKKSDNPLVHMTSAAAAELLASMVYVPLHTCLVQGVFIFRQRVKDPRLPFAFLELMKRDGMRGLYRTQVTRLGSDLPFSVIFFPLYEFFSRQLYAYMGKDKEQAVEYEYAPCCGAVAGLIAGCLTTPLMTTEVAMTTSLKAPGQVTEFKDVLYKIGTKRWKTMREYYKGALRRTAFTTVFGGSVLGIYEIVRSWL